MNAVAYQLESETFFARDAADLLSNVSTLQSAVAALLDPREGAPVVDRMTWSDVAGAFDSFRHLQIAKPKLLGEARRAVEDMLDPLDGCSAIGRQELSALFTVMSLASERAAAMLQPQQAPAPKPARHAHAGQGAPSPLDKARREQAGVVDLFPHTPAH